MLKVYTIKIMMIISGLSPILGPSQRAINYALVYV